MDQYFTAPWLAKKILEQINISSGARVADFAAGEGELLSAAKAKWPEAKLIGIDKDPAMIEFLRNRFLIGNWRTADFLLASQRGDLWLNKFCDLDLIVLNPPFSILGNRLVEVQLEGAIVKVSPAIAFIFYSLRRLACTGVLCAIVPFGLLHSNRDRALLMWMESRYSIEILDSKIKGAFEKIDVHCAILKLSKRDKTVPAQINKIYAPKLSVWRGTIDHVANKGKFNKSRNTISVIHTTNLREGKIAGIFAKVAITPDLLINKGALIVLPRVGRPNPGKIVFIKNGELYAFTKCVIVISCRTISNALNLRKMMVRNWTQVEACYGGTGAPYTTLAIIRQLLGSWGF